MLKTVVYLIFFVDSVVLFQDSLKLKNQRLLEIKNIRNSFAFIFHPFNVSL